MNANLALTGLLSEKATDRARQASGAVIGLVLGLLYGTLSSWINSLLLWGVPLQMDVSAAFLNMLFSAAGGAVAGFITALPQSSFKGVVIGALSIALFGVARALFVQSGVAVLGLALILLTIFLPSVALSLPITLLLRFAVNKYQDALTYTGPQRTQQLAKVVGGIVIVGLFAGSFSQMTPTEFSAIRDVNALVKVSVAGQMSPSLKSIDNFAARATGAYTLSKSVDVSADRSFADSSQVETIKVLVQFDSGLRFECLVGKTLARPLCTEQ